MSAQPYGEDWIDPEVIAGIERVTGEKYENGIWRKSSSSSPEGEAPSGNDSTGT